MLDALLPPLPCLKTAKSTNGVPGVLNHGPGGRRNAWPLLGSGPGKRCKKTPRNQRDDPGSRLMNTGLNHIELCNGLPTANASMTKPPFVADRFKQWPSRELPEHPQRLNYGGSHYKSWQEQHLSAFQRAPGLQPSPPPPVVRKPLAAQTLRLVGTKWEVPVGEPKPLMPLPLPRGREEPGD